MLRSLSLLSILVLTTVGAFATERAVEPDENRLHMLQLMAEPLPAGAVAKESALFYGPDNLYEYMDGAADIFVLYGVRQLLHADLRARSAHISIDVFDMGSADSAFGMYAAERPPDSHFIAIGAEGYQYEGMLNFLQDRYYVKLLGFGDGAEAILDTIARALSARIGTNPALPALLSKLPQDNRKPHSELYMPADPLGHPFLGPAYMVAYASGDQESKLFVTVARDETDAQQRFKELEQHFTKTGHCEPAPELGEGAIRASNSFEGSVIARIKGRYLLLLVNPAKGNEQLLKNAAASLP
jgi:hypothetical protein